MSALPSLSLQPVFFTYGQLAFRLHMPEGETHECSLAYNQSIGDLQKVVSVRFVSLSPAQTLCKEDSNLFVMEMDGEAIMEEDGTPLYKTRFTDANDVSIVFEVSVALFPDVRVSASCSVACVSWSSASASPSSARRSDSTTWTAART